MHIGILELLLYFVGIFVLRKFFIVWSKMPILRYLFVGFYIFNYIPIIILSLLTIETFITSSKLDPHCEMYMKACDNEVSLFIPFLIICLLMSIFHLFFYSSIPSKNYLIENLSENPALAWIKFKKILLTLMFVIPIICMIITKILLT